MIYNDYSEAYRLNQFNIHSVAFNAKLVTDEYLFDPNHKPKDIKKYIVTSVGALNGNVMTTKSTGEIMEIMKTKIKEELQTNPGDVFELIDEVVTDPEKAQRIKEVITISLNTGDFWKKLKDEGVKYFVVEYPVLGILCFHEEITEF